MRASITPFGARGQRGGVDWLRQSWPAAFARSMPSSTIRRASVGVAPADDLHPLAGLQVLVVAEEVLDLLER